MLCFFQYPNGKFFKKEGRFFAKINGRSIQPPPQSSFAANPLAEYSAPHFQLRSKLGASSAGLEVVL